MSLALLFHYLLLSLFRMLVHPSSGASDLLWIYFMCCIGLVRCVLVLRCGSAGVVWCGILMLILILILHHPVEPHRNTNTHQTRPIQHMK